MKKMILILAAILAVTVLACSAVAEEPGLHDYLARIADPNDNIVYTISTLEYGPLEPGDFPPDTFVELLRKSVIEEADLAAAPEGEYVVLNFPEENVRFDFFLAEASQDCFRKCTSDGENETFFKASMPEELSPLSSIMDAWYLSIADAQGKVPPVEANMPEAGWVLDSLSKCNWVSDRAGLEVFLEDTDNYKVLISWGNSAWETTEWTYACDYDAEKNILLARYVIKDNVTYGDNGEEKERKNEFEKDSQAVFFVNDRGELVILNPGDETLEGKVFEKVPNEDQAAEDANEWTLPESVEIPAGVKEVFEKATEKLMGVKYEPLALLAELDNTYCLLCRATVVYPGATPKYTLFYVNEEGVQNIYDLWIDAHATN